MPMRAYSFSIMRAGDRAAWRKYGTLVPAAGQTVAQRVLPCTASKNPSFTLPAHRSAMKFGVLQRRESLEPLFAGDQIADERDAR